MSAVSYMHNLNLIHKDIKPENVVIVKKFTRQTLKQVQIKVIDFGISVDCRKKQEISDDELHGTLYYMPPESMLGVVKYAWDIWSCGIICYMMATKKMPYKSMGQKQLMKQIESGNIVRRSNIFFMQGCRSYRENSRFLSLACSIKVICFDLVLRKYSKILG